jgi:hypothetical protein
LVDEGELTSAAIVFMDWDVKRGTQRMRERSMLRKRANPNLLPEEQVIANIFQGPTSKTEGNYPGDIGMFINDALTIQVHRVEPIYIDKASPEVLALGLIVPPNTAGFVAEYPKRAGT